MTATLERDTQLTLSLDERDELKSCEAVIEEKLKAFYDVGQALLTIRDKRLFRETHRTFEEYCQEKWSISSNYGRRLINAAEVITNLKNVPIGTFSDPNLLPSSEAQARALSGLTPDEQRQAWKTTVETAPNGEITAKHVTEVVQTYKAPDTPSPALQAFMADSGDVREPDIPTERAEPVSSAPEMTAQPPREEAPPAVAVVEDRGAAVQPPAAPKLESPKPAESAPAAPAPMFVTCLIPEAEQDWLLDNGYTAGTAVAALRELRPQLYHATMALRRPQLTLKAELALNALIADFNSRYPDEPTSPTVMLEGVLITRAREKGLNFEETVVQNESEETEDE